MMANQDYKQLLNLDGKEKEQADKFRELKITINTDE